MANDDRRLHSSDRMGMVERDIEWTSHVLMEVSPANSAPGHFDLHLSGWRRGRFAHFLDADILAPMPHRGFHAPALLISRTGVRLPPSRKLDSGQSSVTGEEPTGTVRRLLRCKKYGETFDVGGHAQTPHRNRFPVLLAFLRVKQQEVVHGCIHRAGNYGVHANSIASI